MKIQMKFNVDRANSHEVVAELERQVNLAWNKHQREHTVGSAVEYFMMKIAGLGFECSVVEQVHYEHMEADLMEVVKNFRSYTKEYQRMREAENN